METYKVTIELTEPELVQTIAALGFFKMHWEQTGINMPNTTKVLEKFMQIRDDAENGPF